MNATDPSQLLGVIQYRDSGWVRGRDYPSRGELSRSRGAPKLVCADMDDASDIARVGCWRAEDDPYGSGIHGFNIVAPQAAQSQIVSNPCSSIITYA